jgi:hypothetical protein
MPITKQKRQELEERVKEVFLDHSNYEIELKVSDWRGKFRLIILILSAKIGGRYDYPAEIRYRSEDMTEQELRAFLKGVLLGDML